MVMFSVNQTGSGGILASIHLLEGRNKSHPRLSKYVKVESALHSSAKATDTVILSVRCNEWRTILVSKVM